MQEFEFTEHIMGTDLSVSIVTTKDNTASQLFSSSLKRLIAYEAQFSRFIETSELSILNRERTHIVSPLFMTVLKTAKELSLRTQGYFNPLLQIERFGYTKTFDAIKNIPHPQELTPYNIDVAKILIDETTMTVTLAEDQRLDFGGFLKGFLAETEAQRIIEDGDDVHGVIVNIGGDIYTRGRDAQGEVFIFEIQNPQTGESIQVPLENGGLATSGTYRRTWVTGKQKMHHILGKDGMKNPKTDVVSASVIHERGATGEAYAKALLTLTPTELEHIAGEKLRYVIISKQGTICTSL